MSACVYMGEGERPPLQNRVCLHVCIWEFVHLDHLIQSSKRFGNCPDNNNYSHCGSIKTIDW